jgi:hypothetical protein
LGRSGSRVGGNICTLLGRTAESWAQEKLEPLKQLSINDAMTTIRNVEYLIVNMIFPEHQFKHPSLISKRKRKRI